MTPEPVTPLAPLTLPDVDADWAGWLGGYGEELLDAVEAGAAQVRAARTDTLAPVDVVTAWDEVGRRLRLAQAAGELFASVHPDSAVRDLGDELSARATRLATQLGQDEQIYGVLSTLPRSGLCAARERFLDHELRDLRRSGVSLDEQTRAHLRDLTDRETTVRQAFDNVVRDDVRSIQVPVESLDGMPQDWIDAHAADADGRVTLTTDYPDLQPVMAFARDRDVRVALRTASSQRGWPQNDTTLGELLALRAERARLLGYPSWPAYDAAVKMTGSSEAIADFIGRLAESVRPAADADYDLMLERMRADVPDAADLTVADTTFYAETIRREQYDVDAQEVRRYFDFATVRAGLLDVTSRLFGLTMTPRPQAPVWHEDVTCYDVDIDGEPLGRFYLDLHPREGKFKHAAQFELVAGVAGRALPEGVLVCNFPTGLMEHQQVVTLFHEFGHLIHHLVAGRGEIARFSGITTEWDFVEAPSQLLEEWAWDAGILASFARDEHGTPIPAELVARMRRAKDFGRAFHVATQLYYAALSYWFHEDPQEDLDAQRAAIMSRTYRPADLPDTHFHTSFGHLSGYSSAYYTYMWSLVIAKDLFSGFDQADLMNPEVARRYRDRVLAPGGGKDAAELVADFLGRPYDERSFTRWLAG